MSLLNRSHLEAVRVLKSVIGTGNLLVRKKVTRVVAFLSGDSSTCFPPQGVPADVPLYPPEEEAVHQDSIQIVIDESMPAKSSPLIKPKFHIPPPPTHPPPEPPSTPPALPDDPEFKGQDLQWAPFPPTTVPLLHPEGMGEPPPLPEAATSLPQLPEGTPPEATPSPPEATPPPPEAAPPLPETTPSPPEQTQPLLESTPMWAEGEAESAAPPVPVSPPPAMSTERGVHPEGNEEEDDLVSLSPSESSNGLSAGSSQLLDESTEDPPPLPASPPPPLGAADPQLTSSEESLTPQGV